MVLAAVIRFSHKLFYWGVVFLVVYVVFTCFAAYKLYKSEKVPGGRDPEVVDVKRLLQQHRTNSSPILRSANLPNQYNVEIWGKAAIGLYLWEHILDGSLQDQDDGLWRYGALQVGNITFTYRTGPGITQSTVPPDVTHLILSLNGRSPEKIIYSKTWLDNLHRYPHLQRVAVVILGDEQCKNDWLLPYTASRGGPVSAVFIIYDSPLVDDVEFFQWPLGVAIYRSFPKVVPVNVDLTSSRPSSCNFFGTVYPGSSREELMVILEKYNLLKTCYTKTRDEWVPNETEESMQAYIDALKQSDLTLSPTGKNTECYRFLEALSFGSIPVVEDVLTPGQCSSEPLRLLKAHHAPFIYVREWMEVVDVLEREAKLSQGEKIARRLRAVQWYKEFKSQMKERFVGIIAKKFFQ